MNPRIEKINSLIQQHAADIIARELSLKKGIFISIVKVDTSKDLRYTRIFLSVYPVREKDYAMKTLKKEIYKIQGELNKRMKTKILPRINFVLDEKQEKISEIDEVFDQIRRERE